MSIQFLSATGSRTPQRLTQTVATHRPETLPDILAGERTEVRFTGKRRHKLLAGLAGVFGSLAFMAPAHATPTPSPIPSTTASSSAETMQAVQDTFTFRFQKPSTDPEAMSGYEETQTPTADQQEAKERMQASLVEMFSTAPDKLKKLNSFPDGLVIDLYDGPIPGDPMHVGLATVTTIAQPDGKQYTRGGSLSFNVRRLIGSLKSPVPGYNALKHEVTHLLEYIEGTSEQGGTTVVQIKSDGLFPEWANDPAKKQQYIQAREAAKVLVEQGQSPIGRGHDNRRYPLSNDNEFLSVLTETYFTMPNELQATHAELFGMVDEYFGHWATSYHQGQVSQPTDNAPAHAQTADTSETKPAKETVEEFAAWAEDLLKDLPAPQILLFGGLAVAIASGAVLLIRRHDKTEDVTVATVTRTPDRTTNADRTGKVPKRSFYDGDDGPEAFALDELLN